MRSVKKRAKFSDKLHALSPKYAPKYTFLDKIGPDLVMSEKKLYEKRT